jgi:hypothetical protein
MDRSGDIMNRQMNRGLALLLLLLAAATPAAAAQRDETDPAYFHASRFGVRFMDIHAAEVLAWEQCPAAVKEHCSVSVTSPGEDKNVRAFLDVYADSATHERVARALLKADTAPPTQVFQAVLLAATDRSGVATPTLTPGAQKALADLRGLLPFKSYEQLDAVLLRTTNSVEGHLVGRDNRQYQVSLRFVPAGAPDSKELWVQGFSLDENITAKSLSPHRLISTSFSLKQGETIVVGTSSADDGKEALVLLLTAANPNPS